MALQCLPCLQAHPYLLEEEDTYEPPEDPDSGMMISSCDAKFTPTLYQVSLLKNLAQERWNGYLAIVLSTVSWLSMTCGMSGCEDLPFSQRYIHSSAITYWNICGRLLSRERLSKRQMSHGFSKRSRRKEPRLINRSIGTLTGLAV